MCRPCNSVTILQQYGNIADLSQHWSTLLTFCSHVLSLFFFVLNIGTNREHVDPPACLQKCYVLWLHSGGQFENP